MTPALNVPLAPFADALPVPKRLVAAEQHGRLSVPIRSGAHRFHRDLPESAVWGYGGTVPGPTIEAERGQPVEDERSSTSPAAISDLDGERLPRGNDEFCERNRSGVDGAPVSASSSSGAKPDHSTGMELELTPDPLHV